MNPFFFSHPFIVGFFIIILALLASVKAAQIMDVKTLLNMEGAFLLGFATLLIAAARLAVGIK